MEEAVKAVFELRKSNPEWDFALCVGKVAQWHKVDFGTLMRACGKARKKKPKKGYVSKNIMQDPWWID